MILHICICERNVSPFWYSKSRSVAGSVIHTARGLLRGVEGVEGGNQVQEQFEYLPTRTIPLPYTRYEIGNVTM